MILEEPMERRKKGTRLSESIRGVTFAAHAGECLFECGSGRRLFCEHRFSHCAPCLNVADQMSCRNHVKAEAEQYIGGAEF